MVGKQLSYLFPPSLIPNLRLVANTRQGMPVYPIDPRWGRRILAIVIR